FSENVTLVTDVTHTNGKVGDERSDDTQPPEPDTTRAGDATNATTDHAERVQQTTARLNGEAGNRQTARPRAHVGIEPDLICPHCGPVIACPHIEAITGQGTRP
ncbi:hypothetical protein, partial [Mycobacterium heckeshornense]